MNNEKLENILNLALNATPEEREKSLELNIGYDTASRSWEVIAKASGGFTSVVEYLEKPKRLFFAVNSGRSASCITPLQTAPLDNPPNNAFSPSASFINAAPSTLPDDITAPAP